MISFVEYNIHEDVIIATTFYNAIYTCFVYLEFNLCEYSASFLFWY